MTHTPITTLAIGAVLMVLAACSNDANQATQVDPPASTRATASTLPPPVTADQPSAHHGFAQIGGTITWDERGCVYTPDFFVMLPHGAKFSADDQSILLADGNVIEKDTHIDYAGGYDRAGKRSEAVKRGCVTGPNVEIAILGKPEE